MNTARLIPVDNSVACPFFFDEPQQSQEKLYKIYNDGGHYVATEYFHSYKKRKREKPSMVEKLFTTLYAQAQRKRMNDKAAVEWITPILRQRFPNSFITDMLVSGMVEKYRLSYTVHAPTNDEKKAAFDIAFDSLYFYALRSGLKGADLAASVVAGLAKLYPTRKDLDEYVAEKIEKKQRNAYARKKRFRRKAALNRWNYFVTITYDDKKHTAETFRKKLRKCLSNLHTRRGWKYMGVFELAPDTGRLHFHALIYVPDGQMLGEIVEKKDYSTAQGKVQITHSNSFFAESFGRNDFEGLNAMELKRGNTLNYLLKYISKTGERIVYSRGIPTEIYKKVKDNDIATKMLDFVEKFVLFDDTIDWERDIMHYTHYKQLSITDVLCNPPNVA